MLGVAENIKTLLVNSIEKRRVLLCAGNSELGEVDIKQGIFLRRFFVSFSVCFSIDPIKFDFKKRQGSIWVFTQQREDESSFIYGWFEVI